ncbi:MAG: response regulator [Bryobacteraceae bacterium]
MSVFANDEDNAALERIVAASEWKIWQAKDCREARTILHRTKITVVLCDQYLSDGSWRLLRSEVAQLAAAPLLIVVSAVADEALWAEVLNLGAYDLLAKPFRADEVLRTISSAPRLTLAAPA